MLLINVGRLMSETAMNSERVESPKEQGKNSLATPGAQLQAQREALGLSVEHIADQLKLSPRQVKALEAGDYAALPNMAVTRGFVRAYAKVVRIDPTPLVAMIEVVSPTSPEASPPRKEVAASFSDSRLPLMTSRSSNKGGLLAALLVVAIAGVGVYAYQAGLISPSLFERPADGAATSAAAGDKGATTVAPLETTLVKPGQETVALQSPNVPLVSVPPVDGGTPATAGAPAPTAAPAPAPAPAPVTAPATATTAPATTAATAPTAPAQAAVTGTALVLKVTEDSWIEIRRPGAPSLISRLVKAGSTETFDITNPALLIVGKPSGVQATLGGAPLALPPVAGGTIARVNIK